MSGTNENITEVLNGKFNSHSHINSHVNLTVCPLFTLDVKMKLLNFHFDFKNVI